MDQVDNQRAASMRASLDAKRELLKKYRSYKERKTYTEQVEASRPTNLLPASTVNNSREGELDEEDAMKYEVVLKPLKRAFDVGVGGTGAPELGQLYGLLVQSNIWQENEELQALRLWMRKQIEKARFAIDRKVEDGLMVDSPSRGTLNLLIKGNYHDRVIRDEIHSMAELVAREQQRPEELSLQWESIAQKLEAGYTMNRDPISHAAKQWERPPANESACLPDHLRCEIRKPLGCGLNQERHAPLPSNKRCEINVCLSTLTLHDHPLFNREEQFAIRAKALFGQYRAHHEAGHGAYLRLRFGSIVAAWIELRETLDESQLSKMDREGVEINDITTDNKNICNIQQKLKWLHQDAMVTLSNLLATEVEQQKLSKQLYNSWIDLLDVRSKTGYISTPVNLVAVKLLEQSVTDKVPMLKLPKGVEKHSSSISLDDQIKAFEDLNEVIEDIAPENSGAAVNGDVDAVKQRKERLRNLTSMARQLLVKCPNNNRNNEYILRLTSSTPITPDHEVLNVKERHRRAQLRSMQIYCVLLVNGACVAQTATQPLHWPSLSFNFNHLSSIHLVRRPTSICISIYLKSTFSWHDKLLTEVWVPIPGYSPEEKEENAHAFAPRLQWCQFASSQPLECKRALSGKKESKRVRGAILVGVEWKIRDALGANLKAADGETRWKEAGLMILDNGEINSNNIAPILPQKLATLSVGLDGVGGGFNAIGTTMYKSSPMKVVQQIWTFLQEMCYTNQRKHLRRPPLVGGNYVNPSEYKSLSRLTSEGNFTMCLPNNADVDPNDPENAAVVKLRELKMKTSVNGGNAEAQEYFKTWEAEQTLLFHGRMSSLGLHAYHPYNEDRQWKVPLRHRILRMRNYAPSKFGSHPVPLKEQEIQSDERFEAILASEGYCWNQGRLSAIKRPSRSSYKLVLKSAAALAESQAFADELLEDRHAERIGVERSRLNRFIRQVEESRRTNLQWATSQRPTYGSVVQELSIPVISLNFSSIFNALASQRKRSLKPAAHYRQATRLQIESCRVLIQVIQGRNIPVRSFSKHRVGVTERTRGIDGGFALEETELSGDKTFDQTIDLALESSRIGIGGKMDSDLFEEQGTTRTHTALGEMVSDGGGQPTNSFVQVSFQGKTKSTQPYEGSQPLWKETLELPFTPPAGAEAERGFSPQNLERANDRVRISLFDRVQYDDRKQGGFLNEDTTSRVENRFLGTVDIPFQTLYSEGRVESVLRLSTPAVNVGYLPSQTIGNNSDIVSEYMSDKEVLEISGSQINDCKSGVAPGGISSVKLSSRLKTEGNCATYIRILAILDPPLPRPEIEKAEGQLEQCQESDLLQVHTRDWLKSLQAGKEAGYFSSIIFGTKRGDGMSPTRVDQPSKCSGRIVKILVPSLAEGKILITRYLTPQQPPPGIITMQQAVHFVSLLPFRKDWQAYKGNCEFWCTTAQFLDILAGDWEEHAVLLHNYISWILLHETPEVGTRKNRVKFEVFIILGRSIPEGDVVYVMLQECNIKSGDVMASVLWNACTGDGYDIEEPRCPLVEVGCIISETNIWANIQPTGSPSLMSFDLINSRNWLPFFSISHMPPPRVPHPTVQTILLYRPTALSFACEVEDMIRETLKREMRTWRAKRKHTAFNADVSHRLAEALPELERQANGLTHFNAESHRRRLSVGMRSREVAGLPLHSRFTCVVDIIEMVKVTGIHEARHPHVQFGLAVLCVPYSNNVLSVWVYIVSITPTV